LVFKSDKMRAFSLPKPYITRIWVFLNTGPGLPGLFLTGTFPFMLS